MASGNGDKSSNLLSEWPLQLIFFLSEFMEVPEARDFLHPELLSVQAGCHEAWGLAQCVMQLLLGSSVGRVTGCLGRNSLLPPGGLGYLLPDTPALATSPVALSLLSKPGRQLAGTLILFSKILGAGTYKRLWVQAQNAGETKEKKKKKKERKREERESAVRNF